MNLDLTISENHADVHVDPLPTFAGRRDPTHPGVSKPDRERDQVQVEEPPSDLYHGGGGGRRVDHLRQRITASVSILSMPIAFLGFSSACTGANFPVPEWD